MDVKKYTAPAVKMLAGMAMFAGVEFPEGEQKMLMDMIAQVAGSSLALWGMVQMIYRRFAMKWSAPK